MLRRSYGGVGTGCTRPGGPGPRRGHVRARIVEWITRDSSLIHWSDAGATRVHVGTGPASCIRVEVSRELEEQRLVLYVAEWKLES